MSEQLASQSIWCGLTRRHFTVAGCAAWVAEPRKARPGNPWVWCLEFPDAFTERCAAPMLLAEGFHYAYLELHNNLGAPSAMGTFRAFYEAMVARGLSARAALIGISRGGLSGYRWASENPDTVSVIYGDAPVCDFKSWPGGKMAGKGSPPDWAHCLREYGFRSEAEALAYAGNPVDTLEPLAKAGIPLIHVVGDADDAVPVAENSDVVERRYRKLGGEIKVIHKPGVGHHPHGLDDPREVVEFILSRSLA